MSLVLCVNSTNLVNNGNFNTYQYNFINGSLNIPEHSEICISNMTIPYSWYNINQQLYNNASFQYTWPSNTGQTTYTVNIPNGFYTIPDLNDYFKSVMINNGHYLVDSTGKNVYYLLIQYDVPYYAAQIISYAFPSSLPTGYTNPNNLTFPTQSKTPQLVIINNNFGNIIGYLAGSYPSTPQTSNQSFLSNTTPNGSPVNSLVLRCNLVSNNVVMPSDILTSIPITSTFGTNINFIPSFPQWVKVKYGKYSNMVISICDQNMNPIQAKDANILITLLLKLSGDPIINKN